MGYDLHRFLPASSPDAQVQATLRSFGIDVIFDVGANIGQYGQLVRKLGYKGRIVSFEPLADAHAALVAAAAGDSLWEIADRSAIGAEDGEITINVAGNSASSSVLDMLDSHRSAAPESAYTSTQSVPIARLDTIGPRYLAAGETLYLKVDTQGYEAAVLAGGRGIIERASAVQLEMSLTPLYEGQASFETLLAEMQGHGLALWALWPGFTDPASGRLLQIDAIFARPEKALAR
jgi:FkbM family methyltransferase